MSVNYDIEIEKGSTFVLHVKYLDSNNKVVDLDGMTAGMQVRRFSTSSTKLLEFTSSPYGVTAGVTGGSGGIRLNASHTGGTSGFVAGISGSTGGIYVIADPTTTANVPVGSHVYDLELNTGNNTYRLLEGRVEVKGNTTRWNYK